MAKQSKPGERARDEKRRGGPRYAGQAWAVADKRGSGRFGVSRSDGADKMPDLADTRIESSGEQAGVHRGNKPRKPKSRSK
jgi:hypothetical protein